MKLHQSTVLNNLNKFQCNPGGRDNLMRDREGIYLIWKTIEYFKPRSILEIGFGCGQTLGLMLEAAGNTCDRIVSNDISYKNKKKEFNNLFPNNKVEFIETSSKNLKLKEKFDFIMIDGDHSYDMVCHDISLSLSLINDNGILCIDDYFFDSVDRAIHDTLIDQSDFVPFLCAGQQIFFHHTNHSVDKFLDYWLIEIDPKFVNYTPKKYHGCNVVHGHLHDIMFVEDNQLFQLALKYYNL